MHMWDCTPVGSIGGRHGGDRAFREHIGPRCACVCAQALVVSCSGCNGEVHQAERDGGTVSR
eukprot:3709651-Pyramimonas_sp.AAC.1